MPDLGKHCEVYKMSRACGSVLQSTLVAFRDHFHVGAAEHVDLLKLSRSCAISSAFRLWHENENVELSTCSTALATQMLQ